MMTVSVVVCSQLFKNLVLLLSISVIEVQFEVTEFHASEEEGAKTITFTIDKQIPVATHFILCMMTYEQYDGEYPELKAKYPALNPTALFNKYDQAECKFSVKS